MLAWILPQWAMHVVPNLSKVCQRVLLLLPILPTLIGISQLGDEVFLALSSLNVLIYGRGFLKNREEPLALHLALISIAALVAGFPQNWPNLFATEFSRAKCVFLGGAVYFVLLAVLSPNPMMGISAALISVAGVLTLFGTNGQSPHWATQLGFAFLLIHSLRWVDAAHKGARVLRLFASAIWIAHAAAWIHEGAEAWMLCSVVAPVLAAFLVARVLRGRWGPLVIPLAGVLVALTGPGHSAGTAIGAPPVGIVAMIGSLLLFALGTAAALTKHRWYPSNVKP
jgi:hypothetical protein